MTPAELVFIAVFIPTMAAVDLGAMFATWAALDWLHTRWSS